MRANNLRIGQILINSGDITEEQLDEVLLKQKTSKKRVADILIEDGIVTEQQVCKALEKQLFIPYVDLDTIAIPEDVVGIIPEDLAQQHKFYQELYREEECLPVRKAVPHSRLRIAA